MAILVCDAIIYPMNTINNPDDPLQLLSKEFFKEEKQKRRYVADELRANIGRLAGLEHGIPNFRDWGFAKKADLIGFQVTIGLVPRKAAFSMRSGFIRNGRDLSVYFDEISGTAGDIPQECVAKVHPFQGSDMSFNPIDKQNFIGEDLQPIGQATLSERTLLREQVETIVLPVLRDLRPYNFEDIE
jgi:hypothetical protein